MAHSGPCMNGFWRRAVDEVGRAAGVLAFLLLTLLAPIHGTAEARIALGDSSAGFVLCSISADGTRDKPGAAPLHCDLCVLSQLDHSLGPAGAAAGIEPPPSTMVRLIRAPSAVALAMPRGALPEARGPPAT